MNKTEPPSSVFTTTVAAIIIAFCVIGLIGNVLVILAIIRKKRLRTLSNSFIASLSVADIFYIVCGAAPGASAFVNRGWNDGMMVCTINQYVILGFCQISLLHMVCIAISRFIHVVHYTSASRKLSKRNVILALCITWSLLIVIVITYHYIVAGDIVYLEKAFRCVTLTSDSRIGMTAVLYLLCFVLPSLVVVVCYVKIRRFVSKRKQQLSLHLRKNNKRKVPPTATEVTISEAENNKTGTKDSGNTDDHINSTMDENVPVENVAVNSLSISIKTVNKPTSPDDLPAASSQDFTHVSNSRPNDIIEGKPKIETESRQCDNQSIECTGTSRTGKHANMEQCQTDNSVTFTEICNGDELDTNGKSSTVSYRTRAKISRSIRLKRLRFIRRNPHFRTISDEELQLNRMMAIVFVIIWVGYVPYPLVRFFDYDDVTISGSVYVTMTMVLYVAGCLNPIVYGVMHKRFRAAFVEMLTFKLIKLSRIGIMLNDSTNSDNGVDPNGSTVSKVQCP